MPCLVYEAGSGKYERMARATAGNMDNSMTKPSFPSGDWMEEGELDFWTPRFPPMILLEVVVTSSLVLRIRFRLDLYPSFAALLEVVRHQDFLRVLRLKLSPLVEGESLSSFLLKTSLEALGDTTVRAERLSTYITLFPAQSNQTHH